MDILSLASVVAGILHETCMLTCVHFSTPDIHERKGMPPMHTAIAANITPLHLPGLVPPQARVDKEDIPGFTWHRTRHALLDRDADASLEFLRHAKVPHLTATHLHMPEPNTNGGIVRWHYERGHTYILHIVYLTTCHRA